MPKLAPFRLRPWFRTRIWGTRDLSPWYNYQVVGEPIGEVWLSGDDCVVDSGPLAGHTFFDVFTQHREALLGSGSVHAERFPLLMKVLFPHEKLSVQVHPNDALARAEGEPHGKTECWYALEAEPGAAVALGFRPGAALGQVREAIHSNELESLLNWVPVETGDTIFVDAGTVHAIGPGVVLLEIQQNSDMTYRLYDYGRPRELHLDKGLGAMRLQTEAGKVPPQTTGNRAVLIQSNYFRVERVALSAAKSTEFRSGSGSAGSATVQLIFVASGAASLLAAGEEPIALRRGDLAVVPAGATEWSMASAEATDMVLVAPQ